MTSASGNTGTSSGGATTTGTGGAPPTPNTCLSQPAPDWFVNMPDGEWTAIAGGDGETIADQLPNPVPHKDGWPDNPSSITTAWTGGSVDQARGEYILAGNGGHADYPGNEAYGLSLRDAAPRWRRLSDPTPNDRLGDITYEANGLYTDGRPRAMHSSFQCFGDGRVWFPLQNSVVSGGGGTVNGVVAYHRDALGDATMPLAWTADDLGPWEVFAPPFPSGTDLTAMIFGVCAFDPVGHKVWALGGNSANYTIYWSVETQGPNLGKAEHFQRNQSFGHWGTWVAVAPELRILVAGDHLREQITVLNLDVAGQEGDWQAVATVVGTGFFETGAGAAYVAANHTIVAGNPKSQGRQIHRLQIPTKSEGGQDVYDPGGTWAWSTLEPNGPTMTAPPGNSSSFTKWNIVEDMCNGQAAIVVVTDIEGPTYVYKVPVSGP